MRHIIPISLLFAALLLHGCGNSGKAPAGDRKIASISGYNIKVTAREYNGKAQKIKETIERYGAEVEEIKKPIIGTTAVELAKTGNPDCTLMNFAADALFAMAQKHSDTKIDLALTNKGGLRSNIAKGNITYGDLYNVFPFENCLALLTLNGEQLTDLFKDIAKVGGEAISGATLTITPDGELLKATVGGKKIIPEKEYRIATSDYLSQGNDKLYTLSKGSNVVIKSDIPIRDLVIEYVASLHKEGKAVNAAPDGRITIKN